MGRVPALASVLRVPSPTKQVYQRNGRLWVRQRCDKGSRELLCGREDLLGCLRWGWGLDLTELREQTHG